jgi:hypothetical protein
MWIMQLQRMVVVKKTVQENQYISGMKEDEGPRDGNSELIADLGKGEVLGEKM